ncbi:MULTISPECIES: autotransporter domain-containing protein [unclassified Beijerinckia]|uniref:autotransporter domain-containing protein n=1 Tax=unclassified Beijerinckia TaxID=2638183 RepID=UPI000B84E892|nr:MULTISPECIES: autotransporter domain-containing protein [unclassified Beijerinckia]
MRSAVGIVAFAGSAFLFSPDAEAACVVGATTVQCDTTSTTDTSFPTAPPNDRNYVGNLAVPVQLTIDPGAAVSGFGLAISNVANGGVTVTNGGTISVDAGNTPTAGGTAALSVTATGGPIIYTGGAIINNGVGNAFDVSQNGAGTTNINITGNVIAVAGEGIVVRDTAAGGNISVTTGAVTALTAGKDGIDVQTSSTSANVTIVANGDIKAGNAGIVGAIFPAVGTGNIDITANGAIDARFGVDAENFGTGSTTVKTVGPVTATTGTGVFAQSTGGNVSVTTGAVSSTGNTAIVARQNSAAGPGTIGVTANGNVSGTTGIEATNSGTGAITVITGGTVTGTFAEGIIATGKGAVDVQVAGTVTGATRGLTLVGGTGGTGNISVTGTGGFVGGTGDAANIQNDGSGTVTVNISGASSSTAGEGILVRDTAAGGNISVTTGAVTALTAGKDGIDVQTSSTSANVTIVANGDIKAGNAGIVGAIFPAVGTGNINITANGAIDARFGVDAENFGTGSTTVKTVGPVTATTGTGVFAQSTGGNVSVTTGAVNSTGNTAIVARQTSAAAPGTISVTTNGNVSGTTGIEATNSGTGAITVITGGTVTGTFAEGIIATGKGAVDVQVAGTVTGATRGLTLVGGTGGTGNISVTGTGGFVGGTGDAANIQNDGSGTVTVNISGASSSTAGEGILVRDTAAGGAISVTTGAVTALTAGKDGIDVQTSSTSANVTIVANGDIKAGNAGIVGAIFPAVGTGNIDITANGAIDARFGVDAENFGTGTTTVKTVGPVTATTGNGVFALATGGNVSVTTGAVSSTGNTAIVARQNNAAAPGTISVTANGNVSGTTGIEASNSGTGAITVITGGTVTGTFAEGIIATGKGAVDVQVAGTVTGATRGLTLVGGFGGTGNISVTGTGGFVGGTGDAANIQNDGSGTVTVNISGASSSTAGEGIVVRDTAAGGDISVTTGAVTALTAGKDGIDVQTSSTSANVTIVANGDIKAGNAGIVGAILAGAATGNVNVTANGAIDARFGIDAETFGAGSTTVKTVGPVTATTGNGVFALATGGNVSVTTGAVSSTGNTAIVARQTSAAAPGTISVTTNGNVSGTTGIEATNSGTGAITVITGGTVTGTFAEGIIATGKGAVDVQVAGTVTGATRGLTLVGGTGGTGNISVTGTGGFVGGTGDAANIQNNGLGTVAVNISGASSSTAGAGIVVRDTPAGGDINVTTGAVTALTVGKNGIDVQAQSTAGNVTIVANGDIKAGNAGIVGAILAGGATGNVNVTANGAIDARFGIDAENFGAGSTTVKTVGPVTTTTGNGVFALATGGNVSVTTGAVSSTSSAAIFAQQVSGAGAGTVAVTTNGNVSGTIGINALNLGTGAISVIANSTVTGTAAAGINATGNGAVDVQVAGTVTGATRGVNLFGGAGTITVSSSGAIRNLSGLSTDAAIQATAATMTLTNAGSIVGTVQFTGAATQFLNNGSWNSAGGTSDFGGGASTLINTGTVVGGSSAGVAQMTQWSNLAQFTNQGLLTMIDGGAGDMIRQTGGNATFAAGSTLAIDINAAGQADRFSTSGTATITGSILRVNAPGGFAASGTRYTVLTADSGLTGQYGSLTGDISTAFLRLVDVYDANNAYLDVQKYRNFADAGWTPNQISTGRGLDSLAPGQLANAVGGLATDAQARAAFDQLSGEAHASMSTALVEDSRFVRGSALDRLRSAFGAPGAASVPVMSYAPGGPTSVKIAPVERFAIWGQAYGSWGRWNGDGNAARLNRSTGGFTVGVDTPDFGTIAMPVRVGLLAGYSNTSFNAGSRTSSGSSDNYHMGAYAGTQWGAFGFRAGVVHTWHDIRTSRSVAFMGFNDSLRGSYDARTTQVFGDLGYRIDAGRFGFEPFANLAYVNLRTNGFREMGGAAALTSQGRTSSVTFSTLGLRASSQFDLGGMALTARGTLGWRHAFGAVTPQAVFAFAGGAPFAISGIAIARDAAVVEAGLDLMLTPAAMLGISYSGQFARTANDQSLKANLAVKF